jgi:hypothetical protein
MKSMQSMKTRKQNDSRSDTCGRLAKISVSNSFYFAALRLCVRYSDQQNLTQRRQGAKKGKLVAGTASE